MKKLLTEILCIPSHTGQCDQMSDYIIRHSELKKWECLIDGRGNLYVTKGRANTYPCMVAHMDTVHHIEKGGIVAVEVGGMVTGINPLSMEQTGIGGDDKCGIYAALRCLDKLPACKAAFFVDEECGCIGSSDCWLPFFKDCRFILQADRRGNDDWVTDISGPLGSREFQDAVAPHLKRHGYKPCSGMMSDVMALRDSQVGVSVANMSAGYYNPHCQSEFISLVDLNNVVSLMVSIGASVKDVFPFTYSPPPRVFRPYFSQESSAGSTWRGLREQSKADTGKEMFPDYDPGYALVGEEYCAGCYEVFQESELHNSLGEFYCRDCMEISGLK